MHLLVIAITCLELMLCALPLLGFTCRFCCYRVLCCTKLKVNTSIESKLVYECYINRIEERGLGTNLPQGRELLGS